MITINNCNIAYNSESRNMLAEFKKSYQPILTSILDNQTEDFNQEIINQIVLWKVNRYAEIPKSTLAKINQIDNASTDINEALTREILGELLIPASKGFGLPMISTILRFKNPNIYQIIDQRVYRFIYGEDLNLGPTTSEKEIQNQVELYIKYLEKLRQDCLKHNIPFENADRILYMIDKNENKKFSLKNYGSKKKLEQP